MLAAQRAWIAFRDANCKFELIGAEWHNGSGTTAAQQAYVLALTLQRTDELNRRYMLNRTGRASHPTILHAAAKAVSGRRIGERDRLIGSDCIVLSDVDGVDLPGRARASAGRCRADVMFQFLTIHGYAPTPYRVRRVRAGLLIKFK